MRIAFLAALLAVTACDQNLATSSAPASPDQRSAAAPPSVTRPTAVEGWETSPEGYAKLGTLVPNFTAKRTAGGRDATQEELREHWTILGVLRTTDSGDTSYLAALRSAEEQDPDLDVMWIYVDVDPDARDSDVGRPVSLIDGKELAATLEIDETPFYLLIGPDLTIEAWRGALSATPEDGVKPVVRGVAEIRRQIAAPQ